MKKEEKENILELYEGIITDKDYISPSYIKNAPQYFEIDGMYFMTLLVVDYAREQSEIIFKNLLNLNININLTMFYEKKEKYKIIKELTYHIGNVGTDLKSNKMNNAEIDIAASTYNDAKYIRKEMQLNNEDLYFLYTYISIYSEDLKELKYLINKIEGILQSNGIQTRKAQFRQEQGFLVNTPIMNNFQEIKEVSKRNILTSGLIGTYPFISANIFDEKGIFIGSNIYNNSLVFIDRYDKNKYKNSNMCIFGTSGAGKSFYTKLLIIRSLLLGIEQYIIDPEREYLNICKYLNGTLIKIGPSSDTHINIMEIRKNSIEENEKGYLGTKVGKILGFLCLIFEEINEEEKAKIEEKIIECYEKKGINFDDESLYKNIEGKKIFKNSKDMPILEDLYNIIEKDNSMIKFKNQLAPFIKGSLKFFNNYTNIKIENKLIIADIYELGEENLKYGMYIFTELFWDKIKNNRNNNKSIYMDEIWRLIGINSNKNVASFIHKIFKTIRKYGGSAVAITQDIEDLFSLENGIYGKSLLSNSSFKNFFYMEEGNIKKLCEQIEVSEKEKIEIKSLKKGETLMIIEDVHTLIKIESNELEKEIIGEIKNENYYST